MTPLVALLALAGWTSTRHQGVPGSRPRKVTSSPGCRMATVRALGALDALRCVLRALTNRGIGAFAAATPPVSSRMSPVTRVIALTVPLLSERETGGRDTRTRVISRGPPRGQRGRVDGRGARG